MTHAKQSGGPGRPADNADAISLRFDLIDLETFIAVIESGSFTGAAQKMNVSQPSVTSRIQRLESALQTKLLTRTTRSVLATSDGDMLAERARALLHGLKALKHDFHARAAVHKRRAVIATTPMLAAVVLPPLIQSFRLGHPTIEIQVRDLQYEEVVASVEAGDADLAVTAFDGDSHKLHFEPLAREPMMLVLPKDHPLAGQGSVTLEQLVTLPLLLLDRYARVQTRLSEALAQRGLTLTMVQHATNVGTVLGMVDAGLGVTMLPRYMAERSLRDSRAMLTVPEVDLSRSFGILFWTATELNLASSLFLDHLRAHFAPTLHGEHQ
jgi:DNA-binding transcriptional LysR family regulator